MTSRDLNNESTNLNNILVVDDEPGMRHMLQLVLSKNGFLVKEASNGEEALDRLRTEALDVVLADIRMPKIDGLTLLKEIQALRIPITVIMMSAFSDLDIAVEALKNGAMDYVSKPFKADEVLFKIRLAQERMKLEEEKKHLKEENTRLRHATQRVKSYPNIIGKSQSMLTIFQNISKIADYKSTVLLIGESGTGKELVAQAIHDKSNRQAGPFVPINCGAIPATLLESELFGHVKGAFTDATRNKKGIIEEANKGTLFLDEIGELPVLLQVKLLRFLQEEEIRRVGDSRSLQIDVRIVAATARNLNDMVQQNTFREDLFYRLNVLQIQIPPLRERKDDIPLLVEHFIQKYENRLDRKNITISREALKQIMRYHWPGNVRELENCIERAMVLADDDIINIDNLPEKFHNDKFLLSSPLSPDELSIKKATQHLEKELIQRSLEKTKGNKTQAARLLEISHRALLYKMRDYGLRE